MTTETTETTTDASNNKQCEMPECSNRGTKACRDPEDNLLDLCRKCRREWPVDVVGETEEQAAGTARCWDNEGCPHDDCNGTLEQQDKFNVMCLSCERAWVHWKDANEHHLVSPGETTVESKPR